MATSRNRRNLSAVNQGSQKDQSRNNFSVEKNVDRANNTYITQRSEENGCHQRVVAGFQQDRESGSRCSVETGRTSSELTTLGTTLNLSGDLLEV